MRNFLPWSHPILLLRNHGLGLFKVLLQVLEAGEHLVEILGLLAVLDGLNIGIDSRIPITRLCIFVILSTRTNSHLFSLAVLTTLFSSSSSSEKRKAAFTRVVGFFWI